MSIKHEANRAFALASAAVEVLSQATAGEGGPGTAPVRFTTLLPAGSVAGKAETFCLCTRCPWKGCSKSGEIRSESGSVEAAWGEACLPEIDTGSWALIA